MSAESLISSAWRRYAPAAWSTPLRFEATCAADARDFVEHVAGRWERAARAMEECIAERSMQVEWSERAEMSSEELVSERNARVETGGAQVTTSPRASLFEVVAGSDVQSTPPGATTHSPREPSTRNTTAFPRRASAPPAWEAREEVSSAAEDARRRIEETAQKRREVAETEWQSVGF